MRSKQNPLVQIPANIVQLLTLNFEPRWILIITNSTYSELITRSRHNRLLLHLFFSDSSPAISRTSSRWKKPSASSSLPSPISQVFLETSCHLPKRGRGSITSAHGSVCRPSNKSIQNKTKTNKLGESENVANFVNFASCKICKKC